MAGSLNHIVGEDGRFRMDLIENMRDAREALEECFEFIYFLSHCGSAEVINRFADACKAPKVKRDLKLSGPIVSTSDFICAAARPHLSDYEIAHLIEWHRDEQIRTANDEDYASAADHKIRGEFWRSVKDEMAKAKAATS